MATRFALRHVDADYVGIRYAADPKSEEDIGAVAAENQGASLSFTDRLPPAFGGGVIFDSAAEVAEFGEMVAAAARLLGTKPPKQRRQTKARDRD